MCGEPQNSRTPTGNQNTSITDARGGGRPSSRSTTIIMHTCLVQAVVIAAWLGPPLPRVRSGTTRAPAIHLVLSADDAVSRPPTPSSAAAPMDEEELAAMLVQWKQHDERERLLAEAAAMEAISIPMRLDDFVDVDAFIHRRGPQEPYQQHLHQQPVPVHHDRRYTSQCKAVRNSDQLYVTLGDKHELINAR